MLLDLMEETVPGPAPEPTKATTGQESKWELKYAVLEQKLEVFVKGATYQGTNPSLVLLDCFPSVC